MRIALQNEPHRYFDIPDDVSLIRMDPFSGFRQIDDSKPSVAALFKKGTEPPALH